MPLNDTLKINSVDSTDIIFFGCSFTYGDACYADSTFAHIVANQLKLRYINAGVCGYGLAQIYLLAQELIPKYKPKYVVIQYSEWLIDRALNYYAPTYFGTLYVPYFVKKNKRFEIQKPIIINEKVVSLDREYLKERYSQNAIRFFVNLGVPYFVSDDLDKVCIFFSGVSLPKNDEQSKTELAKQIYTEIIHLAIKYQSKPIILIIGNPKTFEDYKQSFLSEMQGGYLCDAVKAHQNYLNQDSTLNYARAFYHWRTDHNGNPVIVDKHPNNLSHRIIANTIIEVIQSLNKESGENIKSSSR